MTDTAATASATANIEAKEAEAKAKAEAKEAEAKAKAEAKEAEAKAKAEAKTAKSGYDSADALGAGITLVERSDGRFYSPLAAGPATPDTAE